MGIFDDIDDMFSRAEREWELKRKEFDKLSHDPCCKIPEVGDRIVFCGGPIGMGFAWTRIEARVDEVCSSAYKVTPFEYGRYAEYATWIHPNLIVDVLPKASVTIKEHSDGSD